MNREDIEKLLDDWDHNYSGVPAAECDDEALDRMRDAAPDLAREVRRLMDALTSQQQVINEQAEWLERDRAKAHEAGRREEREACAAVCDHKARHFKGRIHAQETVAQQAGILLVAAELGHAASSIRTRGEE